MTDQLQTGPWLAPGEPVDLSNCEREPIHVPGSIQPHGVLLAVTEPDLVVEQVSDNLADLVGMPAADALGRRLPEVLGMAAAGAVARSASAFGDLRERNPVELAVALERLLSDGELRVRLAHAARTHIERTFDVAGVGSFR